MGFGCASSMIGGGGLALVAILVVFSLLLFRRKSKN